MNPLTSVAGTIISGFVLSILIMLGIGMTGLNVWAMEVWFHVLAGVVWIGLLYYFNFVQVPAVGEALGDEGGPGPAAINKYVAPRALLWFRWGAVATWLTGVGALENLYQGEGSGPDPFLRPQAVLVGRVSCAGAVTTTSAVHSADSPATHSWPFAPLARAP